MSGAGHERAAGGWASLLLPARLYLGASTALRRWLDRGDRLTGAILGAALTADEKSALGVRLYDASTQHRGTALFPWERAWLTRRLPPPPARVLVGACGAGRELLALADDGYALDAFEPAPSLARTAAARLGERARLFRLRYEELAAAVLDGASGPATALAHERYDAVLLGWGSLTHVVDAGERTRLMQTLARLCPSGPWLASFWCDDATATPAPATGRMERLGAATGRRLARLRGRGAEPSPRESFLPNAGFAYRFSTEEIEALGRAVGRRVLWDDDGADYPHVAFVAA